MHDTSVLQARSRNSRLERHRSHQRLLRSSFQRKVLLLSNLHQCSPRRTLPVILIWSINILPPSYIYVLELAVKSLIRFRDDVQHRLRSNIDWQVGSGAAHVCLQPLSKRVSIIHRQLECFMLTPGLIGTKMKPSLPKSWAYCTVSMFKAAFEILYPGVGAMANSGAIVIDPSVEVLLVLVLFRT